MVAYPQSRGIDEPPLKGGAVAGGASFVVGYIVTLVVVAGVVLAGYVDARDLQEGAIAGATLAIGTILPALLGTLLFSVETTGFGFALVEGVLLVGLFYPAVFGAIGGIFGTEL